MKYMIHMQDNPSQKPKRKNPWGTGSGGNNGSNGPHNGGQQNGPNNSGDLDEMIRQFQDGLNRLFGGGNGSNGGNGKGPLPSGDEAIGKIIGLAVIAVALLWLSSGFYTIQPGEHGVIQRFGELTRTETKEGLGYRIPWPVESLTKVNVTENRSTQIGFFETYSRSGSGQVQDIPAESLMLTSDANIVDLDLTVLWDISSASDYLFNIENPQQNIKQVAESAIREVVGQTPMFSLITQNRSEVANRAKDIMRKTLDNYQAGVNIQQVLIKAAEVHPDVQSAFQDVQSAKQDAEERQNKAQAYSKEVIPEARGQAKKMLQEAKGYKESVVAKATGDADRFTAILQSYRTGKDVTRERIYLETMEEVLGKTQKTIIDQSGGNGVVPFLPLNEINKRPATAR